jgi:hypothetical protein
VSALTINGIAVPVEEGLELDEDVVGAGLDRGQDGSARNNFNAIKRRLAPKTPPMLIADAQLIGALLKGVGDHWTFDTDAYSDKGVGWTAVPTMPAGCSIISATPTPKRGAGALQIDANAAHSIAFPLPPLTDGWCFAVWFSLAAAAFDLWIVSGTGTVASGGAVAGAWKNGVAQSSVMPAWAAIDATAKTLTLKGQAGGTDTFDDLVVLPVQMSSTLLSQFNTFMTANAWPAPYPVLTAAGDFHPVSLSMLGRLTKSTIAQGVMGGSFQDNLRRLEFELWEQ